MHDDEREPPHPVGPVPAEPARPGDVPAARGLRLAVVPGVSPGRWLRVWQQRLPEVPLVLVPVAAAEAEATLGTGAADAALLRMPVDRDRLSAIPLYTETTVVVVPTDHLVVAADEVTTADLADDVVLVPADDVLAWSRRPSSAGAAPSPPTTAGAVELVAAGAGLLVVPQSLARLHHRRDLTYRPVTDAPTSSVGLAWVTDEAPELVEELIGIVRGRTANSSRGRAAPGTGGDGGATGGAPGRGGSQHTGSAGAARRATAGGTGRAAGSGGTRRGGQRRGGSRRGPGTGRSR